VSFRTLPKELSTEGRIAKNFAMALKMQEESKSHFQALSAINEYIGMEYPELELFWETNWSRVANVAANKVHD
jgi:hypothetical protein